MIIRHGGVSPVVAHVDGRGIPMCAIMRTGACVARRTGWLPGVWKLMQS
jgi:hypothetical protein